MRKSSSQKRSKKSLKFNKIPFDKISEIKKFSDENKEKIKFIYVELPQMYDINAIVYD